MESLSADEIAGPYENWHDDLPDVRVESPEDRSKNYWGARALGNALRATLADAPAAIINDVNRRLRQINVNSSNPRNMGAQLCVPELALLPPSVAEGILDGFTDPRPEEPVTARTSAAPHPSYRPEYPL